jgi:hypothetical protein
MKTLRILLATILMALLMNCKADEVINGKKESGTCEKAGNPNALTCLALGLFTPTPTILSGQITDKLGNGILSYVEVKDTKGTTDTIQTNEKGEFQIQKPTEKATVDFYTDAEKKNLNTQIEVNFSDTVTGDMKVGDSVVKLAESVIIRRIQAEHLVPYINQKLVEKDMGLGNVACGPVSTTMLYRYFFPNSNLDTKSVYPFTQVVNPYEGSIANYKNVDGAASIEYINRYAQFSGISGLSDGTRIDNVDTIYAHLENGPMLASVWTVYNPNATILSNTGHFIVITGVDNKGTLKKTDDIFIINDPNPWVNGFNGQARKVPFCDLFIEHPDCKQVKHSDVYYRFRSAWAASSSMTQEQRNYSTLVSTGNFFVNESNKLNFGNPNNFNLYRGLGSFRSFPTIDNQSAFVKPWLTREGLYQVIISQFQDPSSDPSKKVQFIGRRADGTEIFRSEISNYSQTRRLSKETLGEFCLKNGDYLDIILQKNQNTPEGVFFQYQKAERCSDTPPSVDFFLIDSNPKSGAQEIPVNQIIGLTFSDFVQGNTITSGIELFVNGNKSNYTFTGPVGKVLELKPNQSFPHEANVQIRLNTTLSSTAGKKLETNQTISFRTVKQLGTLNVTSTNPTNGANNISVNAKPEIVFPENLDASTVNTANISLTRTGTSTKENIAVSAQGNKVIVSPMVPLASQQSYTATLQGVKGTSGATMSGSYSFQFTTETVNVCTAISSVSYDNPNPTYIKGVAITTNNLKVIGGSPVTSLTINKTLPSGLSFSTSNGSISGTPQIAMGANTYTVTATNCAGSKSTNVTITVTEPILAPSNLNYANNSWVFKTAQNVSNTATVSGTTPMNFSANNLPSGLSINSSTGAISGICNNPGYFNPTITASNTSGFTQRQLSITVRLCDPFAIEYNYGCSIANGTCHYTRTCSSDGMSWSNWEQKVTCNTGFTYDPSSKTCKSNAVPLEILGSTAINGSMTTWPQTSNTFRVSASINSSNNLVLVFSKPDGTRFSIAGTYNIYDNSNGNGITAGSYGTDFSFTVIVNRTWLQLGTNRIQIRLNADKPNNSIHVLNSEFQVRRNQ